MQVVSSINNRYRKYSSVSGILLLLMCMLVLLTAFPFTSRAQNEPQYDEISVFLNIQRVGGIDISAVILDETVYLPVADIFSFLKIKANPVQLDSVTGFFINPQATYSINRIKNRITFQGKSYNLRSSDIIKTETNLYLKSNWFGQIFGLECSFNFRSLAVLLNTKLDLPIIKEMRLEQMRAGISKLKGEAKTDTTIGRKYPLVHFGMADWSAISTQQLGGPNDTRLNLALGTVILGGEANVYLNYDNKIPFTEKQQQYQWRFVNNDRSYLRQVSAGKIYTPVTASIYDPIVGVQFTNTPTTYRRSFGTYTLSDITEPNWTIELYVNNVLVDYMKADAHGFFKFEVPLVYGSSEVKLKFYGPWGEERTKEQNISIPFNFLPPKELEYSVSAGMVEDTLNSRFSRASLNYGVSKRLTVGGGVEYLSSVVTGKSMPFLNASMRLLSGLMITGEYSYGVRSKGILSYRLPSNLQVELNYAKYAPGQKAIIYNYLEERKAVISIPIKGKSFSVYSRLSVNQIVLPGLKNTNAEMLLSGSVLGVSTNVTTYGLFPDANNPYLYSNLSLAFRLPSHITLTPQVQYGYNNKELISARTTLEKPLAKRAYLNLAYERNFLSNTQNIEFGFRYDLSFAQTGFSFRNTNDQTTLVESARGSLLVDAKTHYMSTSNRTNVGKGAITLLPYLDINGNGKHDNWEPKVAGLQFRINGGTIKRIEKDTTIRIINLVPYTSYFLELDKNSFDNIAWQMHNLSMKINIDPNQFKTIEIPIAVMGEASGTVYNESKGQGRILVCFYSNNSELLARTMTESDGYYSYLGLKPGKYTARIDPEQLKKLKMVSVPDQIPVNILPSKDGTIVDGLDFRLSLIDKPVRDTTKIVVQAKPEVISTPPANTVPEPQLKDAGKEAAPTVAAAALPAKVVTLPTPVAVTPAKVAVQSTTPPAQTGVPVKVAPPVNATPVPPAKVIVPAQAPPTTPAKVATPVSVPTSTPDKTASKPAKATEPINKPIDDPSIKYPVLKNRKGSIIQVGAFSIEANAVKAKETLLRITDNPVDIMWEDGLYKVQISGFNGRKEGLDFIPKIHKKGFPEAFVVRTDR